MPRQLRPIPPPPAPPPRYTARPLPPYRHVPGLTPHPVNEPGGHAYGEPEPTTAAGEVSLPDGWRDCESYLYGVDLFNNAYFWEAHEAWEEGWHAAGHDSIPGLFLQGLIQVSAAHLKRHLGQERGARRLLSGASDRFDRVAATRHATATYMGIELEAWRPRVRASLLSGSGSFASIRLLP